MNHSAAEIETAQGPRRSVSGEPSTLEECTTRKTLASNRIKSRLLRGHAQIVSITAVLTAQGELYKVRVDKERATSAGLVRCSVETQHKEDAASRCVVSRLKYTYL